MRIPLSLALAPLLLLAACESGSAVDAPPAGAPAEGSAAPPMTLTASGYEAAEIVKLPEIEADNWDDLHNVVHLSDNIISGGEPLTQAALQRVAGMGVKTILSVDGKIPDVATAEGLGMRYVHVPIQYSGLSDQEVADIAKTFQELEPPFYVHCFHGKHRGPAGAAVGRLVLDGASREQTLAEMRQWCGTSKKYEGLYRDIAVKPMPTADESARHDFDFPSTHPFDGTRKAMVSMARHWDNTVLLGDRDWQPDPAQPDLDAMNEAAKLHDLFVALTSDSAFGEEPDDYQEWMRSSRAETEKLVDEPTS
jgi:protein tyrosine phosphatase (PTP) superfamily phosphohydrolase (DUF442 family)